MNSIKKYAKVQCFRVRKDAISQSGRDGHPTSTSFKCSAEGVRLSKHVDNTEAVWKAKDETRFGCIVEIWFKWISETYHYIVARFVVEHTRPIANANQVLYLRLDNINF